MSPLAAAVLCALAPSFAFRAGKQVLRFAQNDSSERSFWSERPTAAKSDNRPLTTDNFYATREASRLRVALAQSQASTLVAQTLARRSSRREFIADRRSVKVLLRQCFAGEERTAAWMPRPAQTRLPSLRSIAFRKRNRSRAHEPLSFKNGWQLQGASFQPALPRLVPGWTHRLRKNY
jgi:hypothetical protein